MLIKSDTSALHCYIGLGFTCSTPVAAATITIIIASTERPIRIVSALAVLFVLPLSLSKKPRPVNSEITIITNKAIRSTLSKSMKDEAPVNSTNSSIPQHAKPARRANLVQFRVKGWVFSAPLVPILMVLFMLPVLASLGFWQLDRAAEKEQLQSAFAAQMAAPAAPLSTEQLTASEQKYLKVSVSGQLVDGDQQFLLDNRVHKGQAGYEVLVPLLLEDGGVLLLNRGWLPVGASRDIKPEVSTQGQSISIDGIAALPPQRFNLGEALLAEDSWPRVLQFEDFSAIGELLGLKLIPRILQPSEEGDWAFERIWRAVEKGPTQNYGYAVQWFALTLALALLVLFVCLKRVPTGTHCND